MPKADGAFGSASREVLRGERNSTGARAEMPYRNYTPAVLARKGV